MQEKYIHMLIVSVIALLVGATAGYTIGLNTSLTSVAPDNSVSLSVDEVSEVEQVVVSANPFSDEEEVVNPFDSGYKNPFADETSNPFAQ